MNWHSLLCSPHPQREYLCVALVVLEFTVYLFQGGFEFIGFPLFLWSAGHKGMSHFALPEFDIFILT